MHDKINELLELGFQQPTTEDAIIFFTNAYQLFKAYKTGNKQAIQQAEKQAFSNIYSQGPSIDQMPIEDQRKLFQPAKKSVIVGPMEILSPSNLAVKELLFKTSQNQQQHETK